MMISAISRIRNTISRHRGWRGLSLVLAFAVMLVAWPQLDLHSHANGEQSHSHAVEQHADDHQIPEGQGTPGVMHVHDASSAAWTLPSRQPQIAMAPPAAWSPALTYHSGALAARPPPHRPPIA